MGFFTKKLDIRLQLELNWSLISKSETI